MSLWELFIIYLAAGAPYGAYSFFTLRDRGRQTSAALAAFRFAVWPVFVLGFGFRTLTDSLRSGSAVTPTNDSALAKETDEFRNRLEEALPAVDQQTRRRVLGEFDRLAGLSVAVEEADKGGKPTTPTIIEAAGHPSPDLAAKCIFQRNRTRLLQHRTRAFDGFVSELKRLPINGGSPGLEELTERARKLTADTG